jgi:hypothetical protein
VAQEEVQHGQDVHLRQQRWRRELGIVIGLRGAWFDVPSAAVLAKYGNDADKVPADVLSDNQATDSESSTYFTLRNGKIFEAYCGGRHWFLLVDISTAVAFGIVDGVLFSVGCAASGWILVGICSVHMLLLLFLRPMRKEFSYYCGFVVSSLQAAAATLAVLTAGDPPDSSGPRTVANLSTAALMIGTFEAVFLPLTELIKLLAKRGVACFGAYAARWAERRLRRRREREEREQELLSRRGPGKQFHVGMGMVADDEMAAIADDRGATLATEYHRRHGDDLDEDMMADVQRTLLAAKPPPSSFSAAPLAPAVHGGGFDEEDNDVTFADVQRTLQSLSRLSVAPAAVAADADIEHHAAPPSFVSSAAPAGAAAVVVSSPSEQTNSSNVVHDNQALTSDHRAKVMRALAGFGSIAAQQQRKSYDDDMSFL